MLGFDNDLKWRNRDETVDQPHDHLVDKVKTHIVDAGNRTILPDLDYADGDILRATSCQSRVCIAVVDHNSWMANTHDKCAIVRQLHSCAQSNMSIRFSTCLTEHQLT